MAAHAVVTPNAFSGSDVERINQAVAAAAGTGMPVVIPRRNERASGVTDVWLLDSAILLPSDTTLQLENCHLKLSDRCRDNMIRSANCGLDIRDITPLRNIVIQGIGDVVLEGADHPRATGDSGKTIGRQTYGTDAGVEGQSQTGDWRNIGVLLAFVENFTIENLLIRDSHCWAISLERCAFGTVRDIRFDSRGWKEIDGKRQTILNQDGLDLRQGCHHIVVSGISGRTGDDLIALTNIITRREPVAGSVSSTMVSAANRRGDGIDDIRYVQLRQISGHSAGHHVVRLLNGSGLRLHDIVLDGLIDTSPADRPCKATLKIGDANPAWGGVTPLGDTTRLLVSNVIGASRHTILIAGSLADSCITNVIHTGAADRPLTMESGESNVRNVQCNNLLVTGQR